VGTEDPNPLVGGQGIRTLTGHGIPVTVGVLEQACRDLNPSFFKYFEKGLPYVTLKIAQSLDGRIATESGSSRWITSPRSLKFGHRLRATHDGIMVGVDTVITDDPGLTVRLVRGRDPLRLIMDSRLRVPLGSKILCDGRASHTLIVTTCQADPNKVEQVQALGVRVLCAEASPEGRVDLPDALRRLAGEGITSILVEGGAQLATSFAKARLVDRLVVLIGAKLIGRGVGAMNDLGISQIDEALKLSIERVQRLGGDLLVTARMA
jgi:diaminohydroxyphosphoribosylaminopyrimidine deaminase/5-amino-6-(5-phosphoribosylamino)uracil reductase